MNYEYCVKEPKDCSESEIKTFYSLVLKGGKIRNKGLQQRILNCKLLAFCFNEKKEIVAISSIKRPQKSYIEKIIKLSKLDRKVEDLNFEIGYSYTVNEYRKQGINRNLKQKLLKVIQSENCIVFSTTAIPTSQRFLLDNGFINKGKGYDGENDKNIRYYEKSFGNGVL